jgi:hydroxyethylthiazole kinase-like uncharacterized protein yjeF
MLSTYRSRINKPNPNPPSMGCGFLSANERAPLSVEQMAQRENKGVEMGISRLIMMENAGSAIARFVADKFTGKRILIVAGTGNNGGDAFVAARHLSCWNEISVVVALIGNETGIHMEEALTNWRILKKIDKVSGVEVASSNDLQLLEEHLQKADVIVTAIFGTGFKGRPRSLQESVISRINSTKAVKISVDIPSGMEADTGNHDIVVSSDYTITMDSPKNGLLATQRAREISGEILVANIGVPS